MLCWCPTTSRNSARPQVWWAIDGAWVSWCHQRYQGAATDDLGEQKRNVLDAARPRREWRGFDATSRCCVTEQRGAFRVIRVILSRLSWIWKPCPCWARGVAFSAEQAAGGTTPVGSRRARDTTGVTSPRSGAGSFSCSSTWGRRCYHQQTKMLAVQDDGLCPWLSPTFRLRQQLQRGRLPRPKPDISVQDWREIVQWVRRQRRDTLFGGRWSPH